MLPLFALTMFLGAWLIFLLQPIVARMALPLLGGSPAVWNTCMVFFQAALLAGYAYAHWSTRWMGTRRQAALHMVLVLAPLAVLPVAIGGAPPAGASPAAWLLGALAAGVGLPFLMASTCAPLAQRWFAAAGHRASGDPYFLYAASNAGSLLALLVYPALVEPTWSLREQSRLWSVGYALFAALMIACALIAVRASRGGTEARAAGAAPAPVSWPDRAKWVSWSFIPSSLMLGATQFLSTDIAAVPLLWIVPLAIYLFTFIIGFSPRANVPPGLLSRALPMAAIALAIAFLIRAHRPAWVLILMHLATLFLGALLCHTRLARSRPDPSRLTEFYLLIALGGVLGGVFNALVAPVIFTSIIEYPLAIVLALLARPRVSSRWDAMPRALLVLIDTAIPVMIGGLGLWLWDRMPAEPAALRLGVVVGIPALVCYLLSSRPVGFAMGIAGMFALSMLVPSADGERLLRERTFFGVYTVSRGDTFTTLTHGTTVHGLQYNGAGWKHIPLGYYHPEGPIGQVFGAFRDATGADGRPLLAHVGLVGMGTGALAAYGQPGGRITFHEIDAAVVAIAEDPRYFTYLADCRAVYDVALGDGRLTLRGAPDGGYGLIVLDAFSSDAIPIHLLTKEAVELYLSKLGPGGLLAFHISNQYVDLEPVLARIGAELGLAGAVRRDDVPPQQQRESGRYSCVWMVLARDRADLGPLANDARWLRPFPREGAPLWTDEFSNIWSVFEWN